MLNTFMNGISKHAVLNDQKDYVKFSLQSKLRAYIDDTMHQINDPTSICAASHVTHELNTCKSRVARKLNKLTNHHIRSIC
jgi:uncharacterized protein (DUF1499 family)